MGDAERGKTLFVKMCAICHTTEKGGRNKLGPNLHGVMGRTCGTVSGFMYTDSMRNKGVVWDDNNLNEYLEFPRRFIPGTKMAFVGVKKPEDRTDLIAYLKTLK